MANGSGSELHLRSVTKADEAFVAVCGLTRGVGDFAQVPWADASQLDRLATAVDDELQQQAERPGRARCLVIESRAVPVGIVRFREIDERNVDVDEIALLPEHRSADLERAVVAALMPVERASLDSIL